MKWDAGAWPTASRIGILGGTFDPPHVGHLLIAKQARDQLGLSLVLFAPARQPPHKNFAEITPIEHRLEMVHLAIANELHFRITRVDIDRSGPTYTIDMLRLLQQEYPPATHFYFIMGMDSLANILSWRKPEELIRLCTLAVFPRPGFDANFAALERRLPGLSQSLVLMSAPAMDISASDLQDRIRRGESISDLVPPAVQEYIRQHNLYRVPHREL